MRLKQEAKKNQPVQARTQTYSSVLILKMVTLGDNIKTSGIFCFEYLQSQFTQNTYHVFYKPHNAVLLLLFKQ